MVIEGKEGSELTGATTPEKEKRDIAKELGFHISAEILKTKLEGLENNFVNDEGEFVLTKQGKDKIVELAKSLNLKGDLQEAILATQKTYLSQFTSLHPSEESLLVVNFQHTINEAINTSAQAEFSKARYHKGKIAAAIGAGVVAAGASAGLRALTGGAPKSLVSWSGSALAGAVSGGYAGYVRGWVREKIGGVFAKLSSDDREKLEGIQDRKASELLNAKTLHLLVEQEIKRMALKAIQGENENILDFKSNALKFIEAQYGENVSKEKKEQMANAVALLTDVSKTNEQKGSQLALNQEQTLFEKISQRLGVKGKSASFGAGFGAIGGLFGAAGTAIASGLLTGSAIDTWWTKRDTRKASKEAAAEVKELSDKDISQVEESDVEKIMAFHQAGLLEQDREAKAIAEKLLGEKLLESDRKGAISKEGIKGKGKELSERLRERSEKQILAYAAGVGIGLLTGKAGQWALQELGFTPEAHAADAPTETPIEEETRLEGELKASLGALSPEEQAKLLNTLGIARLEDANLPQLKAIAAEGGTGEDWQITKEDAEEYLKARTTPPPASPPPPPPAPPPAPPPVPPPAGGPAGPTPEVRMESEFDSALTGVSDEVKAQLLKDLGITETTGDTTITLQDLTEDQLKILAAKSGDVSAISKEDIADAIKKAEDTVLGGHLRSDFQKILAGESPEVQARVLGRLGEISVDEISLDQLKPFAGGGDPTKIEVGDTGLTEALASAKNELDLLKVYPGEGGEKIIEYLGPGYLTDNQLQSSKILYDFGFNDDRDIIGRLNTTDLGVSGIMENPDALKANIETIKSWGMDAAYLNEAWGKPDDFENLLVNKDGILEKLGKNLTELGYTEAPKQGEFIKAFTNVVKEPELLSEVNTSAQELNITEAGDKKALLEALTTKGGKFEKFERSDVDLLKTLDTQFDELGVKNEAKTALVKNFITDGELTKQDIDPVKSLNEVVKGITNSDIKKGIVELITDKGEINPHEVVAVRLTNEFGDKQLEIFKTIGEGGITADELENIDREVVRGLIKEGKIEGVPLQNLLNTKGETVQHVIGAGKERAGDILVANEGKVDETLGNMAKTLGVDAPDKITSELLTKNHLIGEKANAGDLETLLTASASQKVEGNINTFTQALRRAIEKVPDATQDEFVKKALGDKAGEITDANRDALVKRSVELLSVSNIEIGGKLVDVENLVYDGNILVVREDGSWDMIQGEAGRAPKIVSEEQLHEWAGKVVRPEEVKPEDAGVKTPPVPKAPVVEEVTPAPPPAPEAPTIEPERLAENPLLDNEFRKDETQPFYYTEIANEDIPGGTGLPPDTEIYGSISEEEYGKGIRRPPIYGIRVHGELAEGIREDPAKSVGENIREVAVASHTIKVNVENGAKALGIAPPEYLKLTHKIGDALGGDMVDHTKPAYDPTPIKEFYEFSQANPSRTAEALTFAGKIEDLTPQNKLSIATLLINPHLKSNYWERDNILHLEGTLKGKATSIDIDLARDEIDVHRRWFETSKRYPGVDASLNTVLKEYIKQ